MPKVELPENKALQAGPAGNIVMVTCCDRNGKANIITAGMYMPISSAPPQVCIGIAPQRYSHDLIAEQGEFVVNTPSIDLKEQMHLCGIKSGGTSTSSRRRGSRPVQRRRSGHPSSWSASGTSSARW